MKSFSASVYVDPTVRSTAAPVHDPSTAWRTAPVTRLPAGAEMSYVKHIPETSGKRPATAGIVETPFSSIVLSSAPVSWRVTTTLPNGRTVRTWPRLIGYGGGVYGGQKSDGLSVVGQVRSARRPPEFVIAKSTPYVVRIASAVTLPTSDSHVRPAVLPQASVRGMKTVELPITTLRIGASCALRSLIRAWMAGSAVIPIS